MMMLVLLVAALGIVEMLYEAYLRRRKRIEAEEWEAERRKSS